MNKKLRLTKNGDPVYQPLLEDLRTFIGNGTIKPGDWLLGENRLSKQYGISHISVRKALSFLEKEGCIRRIPGRGTQVLEQKTQLSDILILILKPQPQFKLTEDNLYFPAINLIRRLAAEQDIYTKIVHHDWLENIDPEKYWASINFKPDTGVILLGETQRECLPALNTINGPAVQLDHSIPGLELDSVEPDNLDTGRKMVAHLAGLGHRDLIYMSWYKEEDLNPDRLKGVFTGLKEAGIPDLAAPPLKCTIGTGERFTETGYNAVKELITNKVSFTGVMANNPGFAHEAIRALTDSGLRVPEDVSVACVGSKSVFDRVGRPLTFVEVDMESVAEEAFRRLLFRISTMNAPAEALKVPVRIVPGATCMPVNGSAK